jgi:hemerythrin superfamily protein
MTMPRNTPSKSSSRTSSKASHRGSPKASLHDALHLLAEDHKKVVDMFEEFEQIKDDPDVDAKQLLVESACAELTLHARVEEDIFYPAARDAIDDIDLLDEAIVEHTSARQIINELVAMQPDDELYDAKFTVLGEYVKHHIHEEEKQLFPKIKKTKIDLDELGEEIRQRKLELRNELGIFSEEEEEEEEKEKDNAPPMRRDVH